MTPPDTEAVAAAATRQPHSVWRVAGLQAAILLVTLVVVEIALRMINPAYLWTDDWGGLDYRHDSELGWIPIPNATGTVALPRTLALKNNSLGLRDIEFTPGNKPTMLVLGDSNVWGYNVEDGERFSNLLRNELPNYVTVNAGVSGYGTDQEYLLLQRLWPSIKPRVVVLIFCVENDRNDNSSNVRYSSHKPYFATQTDGTLALRGQPVPQARKLYLKESWWAQHLYLARLAISAYVEVRYRRVSVPDPTEKLVGMMRDFVAANGATLVVGVQYREPQLEAYLTAQKIPFTTFEGGEQFDSSKHWTPAGNRLVADRLTKLLSDTGLLSR
jgi:hypothetical protein